MTAKTDDMLTGLDRISALLAWRGMPTGMDMGQVRTQIQRCQMLASDLSRTFNEASSCQVKTLFAMNERLTHALQDVLRSQQPQELMAAQSSVLEAMLEGLTAQTKTWADLTRKVHSCCATTISETSDEATKQVVNAAPAIPKAQVEPGRSSGKDTVRHAAQG